MAAVLKPRRNLILLSRAADHLWLAKRFFFLGSLPTLCHNDGLGKLSNNSKQLQYHSQTTCTGQSTGGKPDILPWDFYVNLRNPSLESFDSLKSYLKSSGSYESSFACNKFLRSCAQDGESERALMAFKMMEKEGVKRDKYSFGYLIRALANGDHLEKAVETLESMSDSHVQQRADFPVLNCRMFVFVLRKCRQVNNHSLAARCRAAIERSGIKINSDAYVELLKLAATEGDLQRVRGYIQEISQKFPANFSFLESAKIMALAQCGDFEPCLKELRAFREKAEKGQLARPHWARIIAEKVPDPSDAPGEGRTMSGLPNWVQKEALACFNFVLNCSVKWNRLDVSQNLLTEMAATGLPFDIYSWNLFLQIASKTSVQETLKVWKLAEGSRKFPDFRSHKFLLDAFCKEGRLAEADRILSAMAEELSSPSQSERPAVLHKTLLYAFNEVLKLCSAQEDFDTACSVVRRMQQSQLAPDSCTFLYFLRSCEAGSVRGDPFAAKLVASNVALVEREMAKLGLPHTKETYTEAIRVLGSSGSLKNVRKRVKLAASMKGRFGESFADPVLYNTAINACVQRGKMKLAVGIFQEMVESKVDPSTRTFNILLNGCSKAAGLSFEGGKTTSGVDMAAQLTDRAEKEFGLELDVASFNSLIKVFCHADKLSIGIQLLDLMSSRNVQADHMTMHTLLKFANKKGRIDISEFIVEHMRRTNMVPTLATCSLVVVTYLKRGRNAEAMDALRVLSARMVMGGRKAASSPINSLDSSIFSRFVQRSSPEADNEKMSATEGEDLDTEEEKDGEGMEIDLDAGGMNLKAVVKSLQCHSEREKEGISSISELLEFGISHGDEHAAAKSIFALASILVGECSDRDVEDSPWAVRLRLMYEKVAK